MARNAKSPGPLEGATIWLDDGLRVVCPFSQGRSGDSVQAFVEDESIGAATLRRTGDHLSARIALIDVPAIAFPATMRVANLRTRVDVGPSIIVADPDAFISAAGAPSALGRFAGWHSAGPAFTVLIDRLAGYPRDFQLFLDGRCVAVSRSIPGTPQDLVFAVAVPVAPDTEFRLVESLFGVVALAGRFDAGQILVGAMTQIARLQSDVTSLQAANMQLRRRLDSAVDLGRERLLLDRLDLFYLLLCERKGDVAAAAAAPAVLPATRHFRPADIDGIGIFDVETQGDQVWRWVGPEATIALRDIAWPVRRVVLYFHSFGQMAEPPLVRVSTGGPAEWVPPRALEGRYAVDVQVPRHATMLAGMLILHLSFDRHERSDADPRLRAAVFSGADVMALAS